MIVNIGYAKSMESENARSDGGSEAQIKNFTRRIQLMTDHLKKNRKDYSGRHGLVRVIGKRKRLLKYLQRVDAESYRRVIKEAGIRQSNR